MTAGWAKSSASWGDGGEDVVAGISCGREDLFGLGAHSFMKGWRKGGSYLYIAIDDEVLHLGIIEKFHIQQLLVRERVGRRALKWGIETVWQPQRTCKYNMPVTQILAL